MKKLNMITLTISILALSAGIVSFTHSKTEETPKYKFTSFTVVESIVPSGIGRSRIINAMEQRDYKQYTTERTEEDNDRNKADRSDIRVNNFEETKLLNLYNMGGIRFQNIAANDAVINSKVNAMLNEGWELVNINTGVEAVGSAEDANGIYMTRFYFKKAI